MNRIMSVVGNIKATWNRQSMQDLCGRQMEYLMRSKRGRENIAHKIIWM